MPRPDDIARATQSIALMRAMFSGMQEVYDGFNATVEPLTALLASEDQHTASVGASIDATLKQVFASLRAIDALMAQAARNASWTLRSPTQEDAFTELLDSNKIKGKKE